MSHYEELFQKCAPFQLNPPYQGEEISEIRGIALPQDYIDFLRLHNGGTFSNPNGDDSNRLVLFSLEEIIKGDCYKDEDGYWLGSRRSQSQEYQNMDTNTDTTPNGVACEDSEALHQAFLDDHIVIGFCEEESRDSTPYVDLIAIDREGNYRALCDGDAEELGRHEFGTYVKTAFGGYVKYHACLYESPMGLLDVNGSFDGKRYRVVDRSEIDVWKKKYGYYRGYGLVENPHWEYNFWDADHDDQYGWKGTSMGELFEFFLSGEM